MYVRLMMRMHKPVALGSHFVHAVPKKQALYNTGKTPDEFFDLISESTHYIVIEYVPTSWICRKPAATVHLTPQQKQQLCSLAKNKRNFIFLAVRTEDKPPLDGLSSMSTAWNELFSALSRSVLLPSKQPCCSYQVFPCDGNELEEILSSNFCSSLACCFGWGAAARGHRGVNNTDETRSVLAYGRPSCQ